MGLPRVTFFCSKLKNPAESLMSHWLGDAEALVTSLIKAPV